MVTKEIPPQEEADNYEATMIYDCKFGKTA